MLPSGNHATPVFGGLTGEDIEFLESINGALIELQNDERELQLPYPETMSVEQLEASLKIVNELIVSPIR